MMTRSRYLDENIENRQRVDKKPIIRELRGGRKVLGDINNIVNTVQGEPKESKIPKLKKKSEPIVHESTKNTGVLNFLTEDNSFYESRLFNVSEYVNDIYRYLMKIEDRLLVAENHLQGTEFNDSMRVKMVNWIVEVQNHFNLEQETFQLTIHILDRYLARNPSVTKKNAQGVCLTAMFIAAKYEETQPLDMSDLLFVCDHSSLEKEILTLEGEILRHLDYNLGHPVPLHFVRRYSKLAGASPLEHSFAKYFADLAICEYTFCHVKPSLIAAASVFLAFCAAREKIDNKFWTPKLVQYSTYKLTDFSHLFPRLSSVVVQLLPKLEALRRKYAKPKFYSVSLRPGVLPETGIINKLCAKDKLS